jgi:ribonuclease HI
MDEAKDKLCKIKCRCSFLNRNQAGASGVILRDGHGSFIAARSMFIPHVTFAAMVEASTMLNGLTLANDLGCDAIEAESDSSEVIHYYWGENIIWNEATAIYADI